MEKQSRKQEALALLALDELTDEQRFRLIRLVSEQCGYQYRGVSYDGSGEKRVYVLGDKRRTVTAPDYTVSVDACLTLPLPPYSWAWWCLSSPMPGRTDFEAHLHVGAIGRHPTSLAIAMLIAWWIVQKEDGERW